VATTRSAHTVWEGNLLEGSGVVTFDSSGAIAEQPVTWASRAQDANGKTSPEELIAAAHATCFSMALANGLAEEGHPPTRLETDARVTLDNPGGGFGITKIELTVRGQVEGVDESEFHKAAEQAQQNCPVSKALAAVPEITLDASLT
jgi:osmotically inducible protein OsmC